MTTTTERNYELAALAAMRLARLERCKAIQPFQADEVEVCANDGFELRHGLEGWRHSPDEIRAMRALATHWP